LNVTVDTFVAGLQESLLDGKYLDRARFENVTGSECGARYRAPFITAGSGFGVLTAEYSRIYSATNATNSVGQIYISSTGMGFPYDMYECKSPYADGYFIEAPYEMYCYERRTDGI
jgi:hypothetical protein